MGVYFTSTGEYRMETSSLCQDQAKGPLNEFHHRTESPLEIGGTQTVQPTVLGDLESGVKTKTYNTTRRGDARESGKRQGGVCCHPLTSCRLLLVKLQQLAERLVGSHDAFVEVSVVLHHGDDADELGRRKCLLMNSGKRVSDT